MEKLDSKSIMIGDWVKNCYEKNERVEQILGNSVMLAYNDTYYLGEIEPIPLTAEILEKNGFQKNKISNHETLFKIVSKNYNFLNVRWYGIPEFELGNCFDEEGEMKEFTTIKYVHELQHALRLCKIEKDIEL